MKEYVELTDLAARIKEGFAELFPDRIWVKAEIREWSPRSNGHCYLTLSQTRGGKVLAESRAMIWKWHFPSIKAFFEASTGDQLRAGITVLVRVQVNFSELYGVSLFIDDIDPAFTVGEKALEKKKAIEKLEKEGYMDMQKELALPRLPRRLAVISAKTAAGLGDFRNHLENNPGGYHFDVVLFESMMQGEQAPSSIIDSMEEIREDGGFDAVLILRGGGSESDLSCFDDYDLAVAIAKFEVPVITAIGHDKDFHIADMVANTYVKTPTALADLFLDIYAGEEELLDDLEVAMGAAVSRRLSSEEKTLDAIRNSVVRSLLRKLSDVEKEMQSRAVRIDKGLNQRYFRYEKSVSDLGIRLKNGLSNIVGRERSRVALKEAIINAADPRTILSRGYVLVTDKNNKVLKTVGKVEVGDNIGVRFSDGSLVAGVKKVYKKEEDKADTA